MSYTTSLAIISGSLSSALNHINTTTPGVDGGVAGDHYWYNPYPSILISSALTAINSLTLTQTKVDNHSTDLDAGFILWKESRIQKQSQRIAAIETSIGFTEAANIQLMTDIKWIQDGDYLATPVILANELNVIISTSESVYGGWTGKADAISSKTIEIYSSFTQMNDYVTCVIGKDNNVNNYELPFFQRISIISNYSKTDSDLHVDMLDLAGGYESDISLIESIRAGLATNTIPPEELMNEILLASRESAGITQSIITDWNTNCVRPI